MKRKAGMAVWVMLVSILFALVGCGGGGGDSSTGGGGADTAAPTVPGSLVAAATGSSSISLSWAASKDDTGVSGYKIYRGGTQITTSATNSFSDSGLTASTNYSYTVAAYDAAGNTSAQSTSASATTLATGGGGSTTSGANFKMPDTNQTTSYTTTFGEDHDYTINPPSYTDNGDGTITDNVTGLVWQKQDDATTRTWDDAVTYCDNLSLGGQTDWRLPSRIELISIVDYGSYNPAINATFFPGTISSGYWSSTADATRTSAAWFVSSNSGGANSADKTNSIYVRCVRGG